MKKKMSVLLTVVLVLSLICALVACNDKPQSDGKCTHDYEVTETVSATCLAAGKTTYKCKLCGEGYSEDINALGHNMPAEWNTVEDATCAKNGKKERKCSRCDYKENQVVQMLPHDYK